MRHIAIHYMLKWKKIKLYINFFKIVLQKKITLMLLKEEKVMIFLDWEHNAITPLACFQRNECRCCYFSIMKSEKVVQPCWGNRNWMLLPNPKLTRWCLDFSSHTEMVRKTDQSFLQIHLHLQSTLNYCTK